MARLSLLDRGVVFAIAHVRGGGEMGRRWYDDGKLAAKPNTFTDFVACADHLVETGWVAPDRLVAEGGSAGGLLMGAVVNLAPERFRVVHAAVPFVDALTTMLDPTPAAHGRRVGGVGQPARGPRGVRAHEVLRALRERARRALPAHAGDGRPERHAGATSPSRPSGWPGCATRVTSDEVERPILLRTEMAAGHGGRSGRYAAWEQIAWEWAFVLDQPA